MKSPRLTLRGLMVVVAIAALASGLGLWVRRLLAARDLYREYVAYHAQELSLDNLLVREFELDREIRRIEPAYGKPDSNFIRKEKVAHEGAIRHADLKKRYERAVLRPWESVELDPPNLERARWNLRSPDEGPDILPPTPLLMDDREIGP